VKSNAKNYQDIRIIFSFKPRTSQAFLKSNILYSAELYFCFVTHFWFWYSKRKVQSFCIFRILCSCAILL